MTLSLWDLFYGLQKIVKTLKKDKKFDCVGYLTKKSERIVEEELTSLFEYLTKKLKDPKFKQYFEDLAIGSNINNLSSIITKIPIPLPPLDIQEKIVKECEKATSKEKKEKI